MTNTATEARESFAVEGLQVSGLHNFEGFRWREAILCYLNGVWAGRQDVIYRPKIHFSGSSAPHPLLAYMSLRLNLDDGTYYAEGNFAADGRCPVFSLKESLLVTRNNRPEVEQGLIRFVRDNRIRFLGMSLEPRMLRMLCLWKSEKRSQLNLLLTR